MKLLIVGATGLVGGEVLSLALADGRIEHIVALSRTPLTSHDKLENPIVDFDALPEDAAWWQVDAVICTLGTTIKKAGSQAAFRKVDFDYPLKVAELAKRHGAKAYALNSSAGANSASSVFYLRTKGEVEAAISNLGFESLTIVRPSMIGGQRKEFRPAERIGIVLMTLLSPLIPKHYSVVPPERIAIALLESAIQARPGIYFVESGSL